MLYRNSWLPGGAALEAKENFIVVIITFLVFLSDLDFNSLVNYNFSKLVSRNIEIFLLFLLCCISIFVFNQQEVTKFFFLARIITFLCYVSLFFVCLPRIFVNNKEYFLSFLNFCSLTGLVTAFIGLVLLFLKIDPTGGYAGFLVSYIVHPNFVASLFVFTIFATVYQFYLTRSSHKNKIYNYFFIFSFLIQFVALLNTFSRSAILGTLIGLLIFSPYFLKKKSIYVLPAFFVIGPSYILFFFQTKGYISFLSRFLLLVPAFYMMQSNFQRLLFGYGVTNAFKEYENAKEFYSLVAEENINNPHNVYVSLILMVGLLFTICFVLIVLYFFIKSIWKSFKLKNKENKFFVGFLVSVLSAQLLQGVFESQLVMTEFFNLQAFLVFSGLLYVYVKKNQTPIEDNKNEHG